MALKAWTYRYRTQHFPCNSSEQSLKGAARSTAATQALLHLPTVPSFIFIPAATLSRATLCCPCSLQSQCRKTVGTVKTWWLPNMNALLDALLPSNVCPSCPCPSQFQCSYLVQKLFHSSSHLLSIFVCLRPTTHQNLTKSDK